MTLQNRHEIKDAAKDALAAASYDPKKIILIHTGVSLALMLTLVVLDFLLENQISETGGLSGLGLRSVCPRSNPYCRPSSSLCFPSGKSATSVPR